MLFNIFSSIMNFGLKYEMCIYRIESHTPWSCSVPQGEGYCSAFTSSFVILTAAFATAERQALKTCHSESRIKAKNPQWETAMTQTPDTTNSVDLIIPSLQIWLFKMIKSEPCSKLQVAGHIYLYSTLCNTY